MAALHLQLLNLFASSHDRGVIKKRSIRKDAPFFYVYHRGLERVRVLVLVCEQKLRCFSEAYCS